MGRSGFLIRFWTIFMKAFALQIAVLVSISAFGFQANDTGSLEDDVTEALLAEGVEPNWTPVTNGLPSVGDHYGVAWGDMNNDGKLDVSASTASGAMRAFIGDGTGNFVEQSSGLPGSGGAYNLVLADFNNDGNLDLAGNSRVYLGDGGAGGSMTWTLDSFVGSWSAANAADMNLDGKMDLVLGTGNGVRVYQGNGGAGGPIVWTESSTGLPPSGNMWMPVIGDVNHDGKPDIVCADQGSGIKAWTGNGLSGPLALWTDAYSGTGLPETQSYASLDIGDVNHDGNLDVVSTAYYSSNGVRVWLGNGGGGGSMVWTENSNGLDTSTGGYLGVELEDVNNDGDLDILVAHYQGAGLRLWLGDGGAGGAMDWTEDSTGLPNGNYIDVEAGDYNNDGKVDFATGLNSGAIIWQNDRPDFSITTYVSASINLSSANTWADVQFSDVNHDGKLDIGFTSFQGQNLGMRVFLGDGTGVWTDSSTGLPTTGSFNSLRFADVDHDGAIDIISAQEGGGGSNGVHAYRGDGTGSWTEMPLVSATGGAGLELADLNHDGNLDVVTGYYENNWGPMIYLGNGDFTWSADLGPVGETLNVDDVAVGDVNHDGHLDIAASSMNNAGIQLWTGDGSGSSDGWTRNDTGLPTTQVWLGLDFADVDHDGNLDLASTAYAPVPGAGTRVWRGNGGLGGSMTWTLANTGLPASGRFSGVEFGDTNLDGNLDLVFASTENTGSTGIGYMRGNGGAGGNVIWSNPGVSGLPTTDRHWGVAFGDMDNDGVQDIATTSINGVRVYKQGSAPVFTPTVTLSFPDGLRNWTGNTQHTIWWNLSDDSPLTDLTVLLNYSYNSGASTGTIAGPIPGTANPNSYTWTTPPIDANDVVINATVIDPGGLWSWDEATITDIDSNPPGTIFNMPADGASNVPVDQPLIIQFDESMQRDSVISSLSVIPNPGGWSWSWTSSVYPDDNLTGTHNPFDYGQTYTVTLLQTAVDASSPGNPLGGLLTFSFTTEMPNSQPMVTVDAPVGGESWTGNTNHMITFTASDAEDPVGSLLVWVNYSTTGNPPWLPITGPVPGNFGPVIWSVPSVDTTTTIIRAEVSDSDGEFGTDTSNSFEIDSTDPFVTSVTPINGAQNVPTNIVLQAFWSESMNLPATNSSFSLMDNATWTAVTGQIGWSGNGLSFNPDVDLTVGSWYTANFSISASDDSDPGNGIASPYSWSFRTALAPDTTPPVIENVTGIPLPLEVFSSINISADIYDDFGVLDAWIEIDPPSAMPINVSLDSSGTRFYNVSTWSVLGMHPYTISAVDGAGNWNEVQGQFNVVDTAPPIISNLVVDPSQIESGEYLNVSATVTDNYMLIGVWISITNPDQSTTNTSMYVGQKYYLRASYSVAGSYSFTVWARDSSSNWASAPGVFEVTSPPSQSNQYIFITWPADGTEIVPGEVIVVEGWLREVGTDRGIEGEDLAIRLETVGGRLVGNEVSIVSRQNGRIFESFAIPGDADPCGEFVLIVHSDEPRILDSYVNVYTADCRDDSIPIWIFLLIIVIVTTVTTLAIVLILLGRRRREEEAQQAIVVPEIPVAEEDESYDIKP